jgi:uncharacterized protein
LTLYLDASVLIPLFIAEKRSNDVENTLMGQIAIVSDFAAAEFSSGVARRVRMGEITDADAAGVFATFDAWTVTAARRESLATVVLAATTWVRRLDLALRTPDAINLAMAWRLGATVFMFDAKMTVAARALGLGVIS